MLVNTQYFREAATYFQKNKRYEDGVYGTREWNQYWEREHQRFANGLTVGDVWIPGEYYYYLNYYPILKTDKEGKEIHGDNLFSISVDRIEDFPEFWDEDLRFYYAYHIARRGMSLEQFDSLPIETYILREEENLSGGHHLGWLKPRGVGASFKGSAVASHLYHTVRNSKSYLLAGSEEFLSGDGIYSKWLAGREFINAYATGLAKKSDVKKDRNGMHFRASFLKKGQFGEEERGYMSECIGLSLEMNVQKIRGKRGQLFILEEWGKFKGSDIIHNIIRKSVEEGIYTYGLILLMGTGGTEGSDFDPLTKMIYNPQAYKLLRFKDCGLGVEYSDSSSVGMFTRGTIDIAFKDKDGNSNEVAAKRFYDKERKLAEESPDPTHLIRVKAEKPYNISEATLQTTGKPFSIVELIEHVKMMEAKPQLYAGTPGELFRNTKGVLEFRENRDLLPVHDWPINPKKDNSGCVEIYEMPIRIDGKIPKNLYYATLDPYRQEISEFSKSVGCLQIWMNNNNIAPHKGDILVAEYTGRPLLQDTFNRTVYDLCEFYDAYLGFENDEPGDVIGYAKRHKRLHQLYEEFELAYDEKLKEGSTVRRGYGMHMGSGQMNLRILQGDKYIYDHLVTKRSENLQGHFNMNLHTIRSLGLGRELVAYVYDKNKNFDRISAYRVSRYMQRELQYKEVTVKAPSPHKKNDFWNRPRFV